MGPHLPHGARRRRTRGTRQAVAVACCALVLTAAGVAAAGASGAGPAFVPPRLLPQLLVATVVLVVLVGISLWLLLPTAPTRRGAPRRSASPLGMLAAVLLAAVLLVTWRAVAPAVEEPEVTSGGEAVEEAREDSEPQQDPGAERSRWDRLAPTHPLGALLVASAAVVVGAALITALRAGVRRAEAVGGASEGTRMGTRSELRSTLQAVAGALDDPDPRRAVVAAYREMERTLERAGFAPDPSETPLELVGRCVGELRLDAAAATRLTELFQWAVFSPHPVDEQMRTEARAALEDLLEDLEVPIRTPPEVTAP